MGEENQLAGEEQASGQEAPEERREGPDMPGSPPPVTVRAGERSLELEPWTYCYDTGCVDGFPPDQFQEIGDPAEVEVELVAAELDGQGPFTYAVELVLDGVSYTADATWPDDEIFGNEPSVSLTFDPPLPAL